LAAFNLNQSCCEGIRPVLAGNHVARLQREATSRRTTSSITSVIFQVQGQVQQMKCGCASLVVLFLGLLVVATALASPQANDSSVAQDTPATFGLPSHVVIGEINFVGLHRIPAATAMSRLSIHSGEEFDQAQIAADVHGLSQSGWFQDVFVRAAPVFHQLESPDGSRSVQIQFQVTEYPYLAAITFTGSKLLSQQQIKKLLDDNHLFPQLGTPADPVRLHRAALAIQSELASSGHPEAQAIIKQQTLPGPRANIEFQIHDGPRLPVTQISFSGDPQVPANLLSKQIRQIAPYACFAGLRNKKVYTP
jgi:outer membrane protein assembly factor BamA